MYSLSHATIWRRLRTLARTLMATNQVNSDLAQHGEVTHGCPFAHAAVVFAEGHVEHQGLRMKGFRNQRHVA